MSTIRNRSVLFRHGDVLIMEVAAIPEGAEPKPGSVLARGEITGHSHRFADPTAVQLWQLNGEHYVQVTAQSATLIHEEHEPIMLPQGLYRAWQQREYTPKEIRRVLD